MLSGIAHVNLTVPVGTFAQAEDFYAGTLGMTRVPVPVLQKDTLAWYVYPFHFPLAFCFSLSIFLVSSHSPPLLSALSLSKKKKERKKEKERLKKRSQETRPLTRSGST